eukprot:4607443-Prymnesium_polylepis.1
MPLVRAAAPGPAALRSSQPDCALARRAGATLLLVLLVRGDDFAGGLDARVAAGDRRADERLFWDDLRPGRELEELNITNPTPSAS